MEVQGQNYLRGSMYIFYNSLTSLSPLNRHSPIGFFLLPVRKNSVKEEREGKKGSIESPTSTLQELNTESGIMDLQTISK